MHKIIMIGPFPDPIHGMSLANQSIYDALSQDEAFDVRAYNTNLEQDIKCKSRQGKLEFNYLINSIFNLAGNIFFLLRNIGSIAYFTPPQSSLGLLRYAPAILLSLLLNKKTILHIHGSRIAENINNSPWIVRNLNRLILKKSSNVIALSPKIANHIQNNLGLDNVKTCMNGVSIPNIKKIDLTKKYEAIPLEILFLSNLMQEKGVFELLESVIQLNKKGLHLHLNLAGAIEPSIKTSITKIIQDNPGYFTYYGIVKGEEKARLLSECAIFCLPSYDEGIPLSILEAYAYGCTVVTTHVGGIPDIFSPFQNGYLCMPKDVESLVSALATAEKHRERLKIIGSHNSTVAHQKYSLSNFNKNIFRLLTS